MAAESTIAEKREETPATPERLRGGPTYRPYVDILEANDELTLIADMPGSRTEDIDVQFENGELRIHAKVEERRPGSRQYHLREYGVGDFYRTFAVSETIDASKISAEYRNGVLTLHLPKAEAAKPRKIEVRAS